MAQKTPVDAAKRLQKARTATATLSERLRTELATAIKNGGVVGAMGLCQTISPDLGTSAADEFGFEVGRTALRLRNPENAPDEWEHKVLLQFQSQIGTGPDAFKAEISERYYLAKFIKDLRARLLVYGTDQTFSSAPLLANLARGRKSATY